jgi:Fe2+ or Zn2+ uptake regulation protein
MTHSFRQTPPPIWKKTKFRQALLAVLADQHLPQPASVLSQLLKKSLSQKTIDKVTLYRNLDLLEKDGKLCRTYFLGQEALYELRDDRQHHHHLICTQCHHVEDDIHCTVSIPPNLAGFRIDHHHLEFYGVCAQCATLNTQLLEKDI